MTALDLLTIIVIVVTYTFLVSFITIATKNTIDDKKIKYDYKFTPPFRVGRKTKRAVLDYEGKEVIVFNSATQAQLYCDYLNNE